MQHRQAKPSLLAGKPLLRFLSALASVISILLILLINFSFPPLSENSAQAQEATPTGPVKGRPRPEFDAIGGRMGAFQIFPKVELKETYTSNVYAKDDNADDDFITIVVPTLDIKSDASSHTFKAGLSAEIGRYLSNSTEDYEDLGANFDLKIDATRALKFNFNGSIDAGHEQRGDPDEADGKEPGETLKTKGGVGLSYKLAKINLDLKSGITVSDFNDVTSVSGSTINHDDRDQSEYESSIRIGLDTSPEYTVFTQLKYNVIDYNDAFDDDGINRDATGYDLSFGTEIDITSLIKGEVSGGYLWQFYENSNFDDVNEASLGADITWNTTPLTTFTGGIERGIKETTSPDASSTLNTKFSLGADHELLRNFIVSLSGTYVIDKSNGGTKEDKTKTGKFETKYLLNRNYYAGFELDYLRKDSSQDTGEYSEFKTMFKLGLQF